MNDFTHHTPKLLSEADAAADLAGLPRPDQALPRPVSSEEARQKIDKAWRVVTSLCDGAQGWTMSVPARPDSDPDLVIGYALRCARTLVSERDALAVRVRQLESVVSDFLDYVEGPPDRNCSCHISPPCNDCVDHSGAREAFDRARAALTTPESKP